MANIEPIKNFSGWNPVEKHKNYDQNQKASNMEPFGGNLWHCVTATHHTTTRIRKRPSKRRKGCAVASLDGADGQDFCLFQTPDVSACLVALRRRYPTRMIV